MIVVDASAVVDLLLGTGSWRAVSWHLSQHRQLVAPDLLHVEVPSAIGRHERAGVLSREEAEQLVGDLGRLPVTTVAPRLLLESAWPLRSHVRMSDAFYLAAAQLCDSPLLTTDHRLARGHHGVTVLAV